MLRSGKAMVVI